MATTKTKTTKTATTEVPLALRLRRAEKSLGSARWAYTGKGKVEGSNKEREARLKANVAKFEALVAELRAERDKAKTK